MSANVCSYSSSGDSALVRCSKFLRFKCHHLALEVLRSSGVSKRKPDQQEPFFINFLNTDWILFFCSFESSGSLSQAHDIGSRSTSMQMLKVSLLHQTSRSAECWDRTAQQSLGPRSHPLLQRSAPSRSARGLPCGGNAASACCSLC